ncbi:hypothetical protein BDZ94DRAFT_1313206 [Collybia nuda]|uniref:Mug135-like C-terminal domain-containing protein n=1 Tax=Collybia nuda TaxID=64659 RepID=A0A9P6CDU5_9AGAR|nr:hypothetical protein BDZ94DRAFT_1313206 [Collybia nuda]
MPPLTPPVVDGAIFSPSLPDPSDPPTPHDIVRAASYSRNAQISCDQGIASRKDTAALIKYEHDLLHAASDVNPELENMLKRVLPNLITPLLQGIKDDISAMKDDISTIKDDLTAVKGDLSRVRYISALAHNATRSSWNYEKLEVVMFQNGVDPTCAPHNLPPLSSPEAIQNLSPTHRDAYFQGYYPEDRRRHSVSNKLQKIFMAVGVRAQD